MKQKKSQYEAITRPEHFSLADMAYNALVKAIVNQDFEPGMQLSIDGLAHQLSMSNTPIREALMRANGERLVQQKTNRGFVVAPLLTPKELHQLFDARHVFEIHALNTAVLPNATIGELETLVEKMEQSSDGELYDDYKEFLFFDQDFHRTLVRLSGNMFLLKAWDDLHVHLHLSRLYKGVGLFDRIEAVAEHQDILTALQENDKTVAVNLLSDHIRKVENRVGSFLED